MKKLLAALVAGAFVMAQAPVALADKHTAGEAKKADAKAKVDDKKADAKAVEKKVEAKAEEKKADAKAAVKPEPKKKKGGC